MRQRGERKLELHQINNFNFITNHICLGFKMVLLLFLNGCILCQRTIFFLMLSPVVAIENVCPFAESATMNIFVLMVFFPLF